MAFKEPALKGTANQITVTDNATGYDIALTSNIYVGGITFDSGTNNLANYVQSGTFTPTVAGAGTAGTAVYTTKIGYYTRVGFIIFFWMTVGYSSISGNAGNMLFKGLPFTLYDTASSLYPVMCTMFSDVTLPYGTLATASRGGQANLALLGSGNGIGFNLDSVPASGTFFIAGSYTIIGA